jgi:hypothetical protein
MSANVRAVASRLRKATTVGGGNWIKQGKGVQIVKSLSLDKKRSGLTFVAEMETESSESFADAEVTETSAGLPEKANAPGTSVSFLCELDANEEVAYPNMKAYVYKLLGTNDAEIDKAAGERIARQKAGQQDGIPADFGKAPEEWTGDDEFGETLSRLVGPDQPAKGMRIGFDTRRITTKKGQRITVANWSTVQQTKEEIDARRAKLEGK